MLSFSVGVLDGKNVLGNVMTIVITIDVIGLNNLLKFVVNKCLMVTIKVLLILFKIYIFIIKC